MSGLSDATEQNVFESVDKCTNIFSECTDEEMLFCVIFQYPRVAAATVCNQAVCDLKWYSQQMHQSYSLNKKLEGTCSDFY